MKPNIHKMMEEEFQESEVIFKENDFDEDDDEVEFPSELMSFKPKRKKLRAKQNSVPINIPENAARSSWFSMARSDLFDDHGGGGREETEMEPPHVIIGRRIAGKMMAFSVCTGNGRTLKGRDLSEVRNSILRLTGFLET